MVTFGAKKKRLTLEARIDFDVPLQLLGDSAALGQVLLNILGNAVKFTESGSVKLQISKDAGNGKTVALHFKVTDSGIGIAADKQEMIFRPFWQTTSLTAAKHDGVGLGLAISKELVKLMGGEIGVESITGEGATFWFTVVFATPSAEEISAPAVPVESVTVTASKASAREDIRLLLVEDEPLSQLVAASWLERLGYSCDIVGNGHEALHALAVRDYDLVLMDLMMPVMGGEEAIVIIRDPASRVRNHAVPVIALTAMVTADSQKAALAAGMNDFLTKPLREDVLVATLNRWLPGRPMPEKDADEVDTHEQFTDDEAVLSLFVVKAPEYVAAIQRSLLDDDAPGVRLHAHKLVGAAASVGASRLAGLAAEVEDLVRANEFADLGQAGQRLGEEFANVIAQLTQREAL